MEHYRPEQLVNPFTLLRPATAADGAGGFDVTESQVGGVHFAMVRAIRGGEAPLNSGLSNTGLVLFVVYAALGIQATDVLLYNGVRYNVRFLPPAGLSKFQEVQAESGVVS